MSPVVYSVVIRKVILTISIYPIVFAREHVLYLQNIQQTKWVLKLERNNSEQMVKSSTRFGQHAGTRMNHPAHSIRQTQLPFTFC